MINAQTIDIVIGMATVYLVVAIICSAINEMLAAALNLRAKTLVAGIRELLGDYADSVLAHPLIVKTSAPNKPPSYVEPRLFAAALLDVVTSQVPIHLVADTDEIRTAVQENVPGHAKESILAFLDGTKQNYDKLVADLSSWFDAHMDRISGGYKRRAHTIMAACALIVVVILNIDSLKIYSRLLAQPAVAAAVATRGDYIAKTAEVEAAAKGQPPADFGAQLAAMHQDLQSLELPIGWHRDAGDFTNPFQKIVGLLITALAATLGAPFWFDVLGKLANMRSVGTKPNGK